MIAQLPINPATDSPQKKPETRFYTIYRLVNNETGNCYIGATVNPKARRQQHFRALRRNEHKNRKLQASFNYFSEAAFSFEIIETGISPEDVEAQEEYHIEFYNSFSDGYNFTPTGRPIPELKAMTRYDYGSYGRRQRA